MRIRIFIPDPSIGFVFWKDYECFWILSPKKRTRIRVSKALRQDPDKINLAGTWRRWPPSWECPVVGFPCRGWDSGPHSPPRGTGSCSQGYTDDDKEKRPWIGSLGISSAAEPVKTGPAPPQASLPYVFTSYQQNFYFYDPYIFRWPKQI